MCISLTPKRPSYSILDVSVHRGNLPEAYQGLVSPEDLWSVHDLDNQGLLS